VRDAPQIALIGTLDTKGVEIDYVADRVRDLGGRPTVIDVGILGEPTGRPADIPRDEVARALGRELEELRTIGTRGAAVEGMCDGARAVLLSLWSEQRLDGALGLGGAEGALLGAAAMRALPVGVPKLMVSTVASGNVAPYVGPNDIAMMYSVTDVAGLNAISRKVIGNAAHAVAGMAKWKPPVAESDKPGIGITMFGVTTDCVTHLRKLLDTDYETYVFHATGTGGQSMEKLADSGLVAGMIDVTTTEVADLLMGGVFPCTEDRFGAVARTRLPYVGSVGAVDMVNFGARDTVPEKYRDRNLYVHNPQVTLMRTTPEENKAIGEWIAMRLNQCEGDIRFVLPLGGVSAIDVPGMPFHDPEADEALFAAIRASFKQTPKRQLLEIPHNINDPAFAKLLAEQFREIAK
jgi:uncharacterized protein (UPF0261 family)